MQRSPGWKAVEKAKLYIGTTVPNKYIYIYIYIYIQKKKKKKNQIVASVPVHPKCVPVQLSQNWAVANVYRYTIKVYRYTRSDFGRIGF